MTGYRSIHLEPDCVHSAYYGWIDEWPDPGFRVLSRRSGPLERRLIVSDLAEQARARMLANEVRAAAGPFAEIVVHDLKSVIDWPSQGFEKIGRDSRMLNVDTFVIDLARSEEDLHAAVSKRCQQMIRKAKSASIAVHAEADPAASRLEEFFAGCARMAERRLFKLPDIRALRTMFADGRARLFTAERNCAPPNFVMTYHAGDKALFLYGFGDGKTNDGTGHLTQWEVIRTLKRMGVRWYDLGGLPSLDKQDGIYRFKSSFGGELVHLGGEYRFRTPLVRLGRLGLAGAHRVKRALGA